MSLQRLARLAMLSALVSLAPGVAAWGQTAEKARVKTKAAAAARLDLNRATAAEMEAALPGVGEVTAKRIVAGRPYTKIEDLEKAGVPARTIERIRPMVFIGTPAGAAAKKLVTRKARTKGAETETATETATTNATASEAPAQAAPARVSDRPAKTAAVKAARKSAARPAAARLAPGQLVNINTASREELDVLPGIGPVRAQAIIDARPFQTIEDIKKVKGIKEVEFSKIKEMIRVK